MKACRCFLLIAVMMACIGSLLAVASVWRRSNRSLYIARQATLSNTEVYLCAAAGDLGIAFYRAPASAKRPRYGAVFVDPRLTLPPQRMASDMRWHTGGVGVHYQRRAGQVVIAAAIPAWPVVLGIVCVLIMTVRIAVCRPVYPNACPSCGYDLRAIRHKESGWCPECGAISYRGLRGRVRNRPFLKRCRNGLTKTISGPWVAAGRSLQIVSALALIAIIISFSNTKWQMHCHTAELQHDRRLWQWHLLDWSQRRAWMSRSARYLDLADSQVEDHALTELRKMPNLAFLNVSHTNVSDDCIEHLCDAAQLQKVYISGTRITAAGLEQLHRRRPDIIVVRNRPMLGVMPSLRHSSNSNRDR